MFVPKNCKSCKCILLKFAFWKCICIFLRSLLSPNYNFQIYSYWRNTSPEKHSHSECIQSKQKQRLFFYLVIIIPFLFVSSAQKYRPDSLKKSFLPFTAALMLRSSYLLLTWCKLTVSRGLYTAWEERSGSLCRDIQMRTSGFSLGSRDRDLPLDRITGGVRSGLWAPNV